MKPLEELESRNLVDDPTLKRDFIITSARLENVRSKFRAIIAQCSEFYLLVKTTETIERNVRPSFVRSFVRSLAREKRTSR